MNIRHIILATMLVSVHALADHEAVRNTQVRAQLQALANIANSPSGVSIGEISRQFHFSYTRTSCRDTKKISHYCEYSIRNQQSQDTLVQIVGIGTNKQSRSPAGWIWWSVTDERLCLRSNDVTPSFGQGTVGNFSAAFIPPGHTGSLPPAYLTMEYGAIPGAKAGVRAQIRYRNQCIEDIELHF